MDNLEYNIMQLIIERETDILNRLYHVLTIAKDRKYADFKEEDSVEAIEILKDFRYSSKNWNKRCGLNIISNNILNKKLYNISKKEYQHLIATSTTFNDFEENFKSLCAIKKHSKLNDLRKKRYNKESLDIFKEMPPYLIDKVLIKLKKGLDFNSISEIMSNDQLSKLEKLNHLNITLNIYETKQKTV